MQKKSVWGYHLILDLGECNLMKIADAQNISQFSVDLVDTIGMKAYGNPIIEYFGVNKSETAGYTLVQLIETSCISAHFSETTKSVFLDIFSCKPFDSNLALKVVKLYFEPKIIKKKYLERYTHVNI